VEQRIIG